MYRNRLFELEPALLGLFQYNTSCSSTQDCLASPEFLDHVTKVSFLLTTSTATTCLHARAGRHPHTYTHKATGTQTRTHIGPSINL